MDKLTIFRFEAWTDGKADMCAIRADAPDDPPGLLWVWFVFTRAEFEAIAAGTATAAEDGYHKLSTFGDSWTVYDLELPNADCGMASVPFRRINMPRLFVRALVRLARRVWTAARSAGDTERRRVEITVSPKHRARVVRLYGCGRGSAALDVGDAESVAFLEQCSAAGGEQFASKLDQLLAIARNTTRGFHQRASVRIRKDWDGFFWTVLDPRGRSSLHGGLINHGRDGSEPNWSLHT